MTVELFQQGHFQLHSGTCVGWKIESDALCHDEWDTLALMLADVLPRFGQVIGVPRGGLQLAESLLDYITEGPLLIVDDVLTTGASMEGFKQGQQDIHGVFWPDPIGAVVFARSECPSWITPLFQMPRTRQVNG